MDKLGDFISRQKWLEPIETALGGIADTIFLKDFSLGEKVRNFFHGTWFGHPLHPMITDIPLGAWTAATALDVYELATGDDSLTNGADFAVGLGLFGAAGAALTGLNDWNYTYEKPRRVGALHALTNIAATGCYLASWWQRRHGNRDAGLTTGFAGFGLSLIGGYLGGHLVYNERIGVNHAPEELPDKFTPVMKEADLRENKMQKAKVGEIPVLIVRRGGHIFMMAEKCSHLGGPLSEGKFDGETVTCPWHESNFSLEDGRVLVGPAVYAQPCFKVRVRDGQIEAKAPPGMVANPY